MKKIAALLIAIMMLAAFAAGCGTGDAGANTAAPSEAPAASDAPAATEEVVDPPSTDEGTPTIDRIKAAGKLTMLTNAAFPPFEYLDDANNIAGVDVEIAQAIADEIGVELEIVDMDFDGIVMAIQNGQGDIAAAGMTATDERRNTIDFSINYLDATQLIIVPEGSDIATPADLAGKTIGVQAGTTGALFVEDMVDDAKLSAFKTGPDAGLALANGQLDAVVIDEMPAKKIVEANAGLVLLDEPLTVEQYAIGIAKGNDDLTAVVNTVLERLLAEGAIDALIAKHMG